MSKSALIVDAPDSCLRCKFCKRNVSNPMCKLHKLIGGSHNFKSVGAETICQGCGRKLTDEEIDKLLTQAYEDRNVITYECIEEFWVDLVDGDGFTEKQDGVCIQKGSRWKIDTDAVNVTGADIHLEELAGLNWLELSKDRLETYFKPIN